MPDEIEEPIVNIPQPVEPPVVIAPPLVGEPEMPAEEEMVQEEVKPEEEEDELADLFEVPQPEDNDINTDDIFESPGEEDLSDLVDVSNEDIMGEAPEPKKQYRITRPGRRSIRRYQPPTSLGGMRS